MQSVVKLILRLKYYFGCCRAYFWVLFTLILPVNGQVTYTLGNTGHYTIFTDGGGAFSNAGGTELGCGQKTQEPNK